MPAPPPPLSPIEEHAQKVISHLLGVPVKQHDDQSAPGLPDLRIEYPDRSHGVAEVVRDVDRLRPFQRDALTSRGWSIDDPSLTRSWAIDLEPDARIDRLQTNLPSVLKSAEQADRRHIQPLPWSQLDPIAYELHRLRVVRAHSFPRERGTPAIWFAPGRAFTRTGDLDVLPAWCATVLAANDDVAKKLARAPFTERHAFLVATPDGDLTAYWTLTTRPHPGWPDRPPDALPTATPELPAGVDCVWACGPERVLAWFPDRGWINAS
jgi:hypothetical protein